MSWKRENKYIKINSLFQIKQSNHNFIVNTSAVKKGTYIHTIVINRIRGRTLHEIAPEQYGFIPDKGTGNAIFVLRMLVERSIEKQKDVYVCTVKHKLLMELLQSLDVDQAEIQLMLLSTHSLDPCLWGSPIIPLLVHLASSSITPAGGGGLSTNQGVTVWCICGCS